MKHPISATASFRNLVWSDITVTVPDRETKLPKKILSAVSGCVGAGKSRFCRVL